MTEEEALGKWCPFVRAVSADSVSATGHSFQAGQPAINRIVHGDGFVYPKGVSCCGSQCMAWRWETERKSLPVGIDPDGAGWEKDGVPSGIGGATTYRQGWLRRGGLCGLAGPIYKD